MPLDFAYPDPLIEGRLVRRYKRFLADVELADGEVRTVHCPNPGSMRGCSTPGARVRIRDSRNPKRKLRFTLEQVKSGRAWVGVNTMLSNPAVESAVRRGGVQSLAGYDDVRREVADGHGSRFDLCLTGPADRCWVEIKNTTLRVGREARFPDAVTARGTKHLAGLQALVAAGNRAVQVFTVSRADVEAFRPAWDIDPVYAEALGHAAAAGVEVLALAMRVRRDGLTVGAPIPVHLDRPASLPVG